MYARVNEASLLADEKKLIHPSHPHAIYRADLVLLGQPAGEAESTARGPSQVEHEKVEPENYYGFSDPKGADFSILLTCCCYC